MKKIYVLFEYSIPINCKCIALIVNGLFYTTVGWSVINYSVLNYPVLNVKCCFVICTKRVAEYSIIAEYESSREQE